MVNNNTAAATATATTPLALTYRRLHTRGSNGHASYGLAGCKGIAFVSNALAQGNVWPSTGVSMVPNGTSAFTLVLVPGAGATAVGGTRYNYYVPGQPGRVQVAAAWFAGNVPPATLALYGVALAPAAVRAGAGATSAVVAAANVAQAAAQAQPVAVPAVVAATVAQGAAVVVAAAQGKGKGNKGANKAHTAKVG